MSVTSYKPTLKHPNDPFNCLFHIAPFTHQVKQTISFGGHETRVLEMQDYLMKFHGNNKSQLIKNLIRKEIARYSQSSNKRGSGIPSNKPERVIEPNPKHEFILQQQRNSCDSKNNQIM